MTMPEYSFDFANANAIAFPIPLVEPVTIAILYLVSLSCVWLDNYVILNSACIVYNPIRKHFRPYLPHSLRKGGIELN
jgi:hypothetical protein